MICPSCAGEKQVFCFENRGLNYRDHTSGYKKCRTCNGFGEITLQHSDILTYGKKCRDDRISRGVSLIDEAKIRGMSAGQLSAIENGRFT